MVCLGLEPRAADRKAQTNPLGYGGTCLFKIFILLFFQSFNESVNVVGVYVCGYCLRPHMVGYLEGNHPILKNLLNHS